MARTFRRLLLATSILLVTACASAEDRFNEGIDLQAQGRYMEAAYRYADAVEKDASLQEARDQLLIVGDSAIMLALEEADRLDGRDDPVEAARQFQAIDRLMSRVRSVGMRLTEPEDYRVVRRTAFDRAIEWYMVEGEDASREGRWQYAVRAFASARSDFSPTRDQSEASMDAQTRVLIDWAEIELGDRRPRAAFGVAALPVSATGQVRDLVGSELEIELDEGLETGYWLNAPPFVQMAEADILRRELRGLLRGRIPQSPALVGRALNLIGADYGVMVEVTSIRISDENFRVEERTAVIRRKEVERSRSRERERDAARDECVGPGRGQGRGRGVGLDRDECRGRGWGGGRSSDQNSNRTSSQRWVTYEIDDTVTYRIISGDRVVRAEAEVLLVNLDGRAVAEFSITAHQETSFREGEFDGDPWQLQLNNRNARLFEFDEWDNDWSRLQRAVVDQLALGISAETFREVLSWVE